MNPYQIINNLIKPLPQRNKEILIRRFGLNRKNPQTLQEIASDYNLSRERIRQIQNRSLAQIKNRLLYKPILFKLKKIFIKHKKLASEEKLAREFNILKAPYFFILHLDDDFLRFKGNRNFKCHWSIDAQAAEKAQKGILALTSYLEEQEKLISKKVVSAYLNLEHLDISKLIGSNIFGEFGLIDWPEVTPVGVKDKAYLILKHIKKPLHFKKITDLINQAHFPDGRIAYAPTVHNELIKDPRFVLKDRGVYGLRE